MCPSMPVRAVSTAFLVRVWRPLPAPIILVITPSLANTRVVQTGMSRKKLLSSSLEHELALTIWFAVHTPVLQAQRRVNIRLLIAVLNSKPSAKVINVTNSNRSNLTLAPIKLTVDSKRRRTHQKANVRKRTWTRCCPTRWLRRTHTNTRLWCARAGWLAIHANSVIRAIMHTASNS